VLLMLALLKQLPLHHASMTRGEWLAMSQTMQMRELRGKVVGLLGFGRIAQHVGRRVRAFDADVRYSKPRRAPLDEEKALGAVHLPLDELLAASDILSLHLPLQTHTRGIIDARAIASMRPGSWLINTARGPLVDEAALIDALRGGHLAGAGLDVFAHEPLDPHSPLLSLPNVVLTPHIAGATRDTWTHRISAAWENVRRIESGQAPLSQIA
jgi:phosphoglycerate dehydrogenase-like enzyme